MNHSIAKLEQDLARLFEVFSFWPNSDGFMNEIVKLTNCDEINIHSRNLICSLVHDSIHAI